MPIKTLKTISVAKAVVQSDAAIQLPEDKQTAFYSLLESFLLLNPSPTDEHIHQLATSVGMDPETFEQLIYEFFGSVLKEDELSDGEDLPSAPSIAARLTAAGGVFDFNDIEDDSDVTAAKERTAQDVLNQAWHELQSQLRQHGDPEEIAEMEDEAKVDSLIACAEGDPDFAKVFGTGPAASRAAQKAAEAFVKHPPFQLSASDADGRAAEGDGVADPELLGKEDPIKEASEGDGDVDEEQLQENLGENE